MRPDDARLLTLAEAVADGLGIDWADAEASAGSPEQRDVIRQLRVLADVAQLHRTVGGESSTTFLSPPSGLPESTVGPVLLDRPDPPRPTLRSWGPLQIREEVGSGAFGVVYRAWDTRLDREVALKLLRGIRSTEQDLASTVIKEGRLLAQIRHPNVVTVFGADCFDGSVGVWMEFVNGRTLKEIQQEQGPFSAQEAVLVGLDLCRALAAVHKAGFLHRDIKAQNVMREAGGRIVLMDFGAAGFVRASADSMASITGTPLYLAPEVLHGEQPSVQSDLYSLGVLLYYLVSGQFPVSAPSLAELRQAHEQKKRALLRDVRPDLPLAFVRVIDDCAAVLPDQRPDSAGAMEALLETAVGMHPREETDSGTITAPRIAAPRGLRRVAYALVILAGIGLLSAGALGTFWRAPQVPQRNSVAVLPLKNLSADPENDYFSDGITEDIDAQLAKIGDLRVISAASVARYKDRRKTATEIGSDLGVATVLDGSVRRVGNRVRIVSRLLDAQTGEQLWSESYDRELKDIFAIQSDVSRQIAIALKGELSAVDTERLRPGREQNFDAFDLYLKGRYYWNMRTEDSLKRSIQYFQEAIDRDPSYALAYAGLADAYNVLGVYAMIPRAEAASRASAAASKALELDDSLAEAHAALALFHLERFEWNAAEAGFKRALELKPGYATAHHWYADYLSQRGRLQEAMTEIRMALALDPLSSIVNAELGSILILARRYDEAIVQLEKTLQADPAFALAHTVLAEAYVHKTAYDRALAELDKAAALGAGDADLWASIGYVHAVAGRRAEALKIAGELAERYRRHEDGAAVGAAFVYVGLNDKDRAFEWLDRARKLHDPWVAYLKVDPRFDNLRTDSRFEGLLASIGLER